MKNIFALLATMMLAACASAPPPSSSDQLFRDKLFAAPSVRIDPEAVLALDDNMRQYLHTEINTRNKNGSRQRDLFDALYSRGKLQLEYESTLTRNAQEAFEARSGNCLSLVIMTAALAKELGLQIRYQTVLVEEVWSRSGGIHFASGHVNLSLGKKQVTLSMYDELYQEPDWLQIDFTPPQRGRPQKIREIEEKTVIAMYMNNRAAESLERGRLDDAYWWARHAIGQDPQFLSTYNTLGVIYRRHGNLAEAEAVLQHARAQEPDNTIAIANLALVYTDEGRHAEAADLTKLLERRWPDRPFKFFDQGIAAMEAGDFRLAKEMFEKEVQRDPYYHEFHFWLARAHLGLGEIKQADRYLKEAQDYSPTYAVRGMYAAKLDWLRSHTTQ